MENIGNNTARRFKPVGLVFNIHMQMLQYVHMLKPSFLTYLVLIIIAAVALCPARFAGQSCIPSLVLLAVSQPTSTLEKPSTPPEAKKETDKKESDPKDADKTETEKKEADKKSNEIAEKSEALSQPKEGEDHSVEPETDSKEEEKPIEDEEKEVAEGEISLSSKKVDDLYRLVNEKPKSLEEINLQFAPSFEKASLGFFGRAQEVNPDASAIPFAETPFRRFQIIFFVSLPVAFFINTTLLDMYTQRVPFALPTQDHKPGTPEREAETKPGNYTNAMKRYIVVTAFILAVSIAWDDYRNVFTDHKLPIHPADRMILEEKIQKGVAFEPAYLFPLYTTRF